MSSITNDKIRQLVNKYEHNVIEIRRDIHMHPELSFQEKRTSELVASKLEELGIEVQSGIGKTGVIGILKGSRPGKTLALRADMDALPLDEDNDLPFKSVNAGVMHACGHDCHTANLLGVAMILSEIKNELSGTIKFIFQPAEENGGGGREMVKEGALIKPDVDAIFGLHVKEMPLGTIEVGYGNIMAYSDRFILRVKGKQAHTSKPQQGVDSIVISANIITALQSIVSRQIDPLETATFSVGQINGGTAPNIVPDLVEMVGMIRCMSKDTREIIKTNIEKIAKSVAEGMSGECEFIFKEGYPAVFNNNEMADYVKELAIERCQDIKDDLDLQLPPEFDLKELVRITDKPTLGAEDFGFYSHEVPACFFYVGTGNPAPIHSPKFMVDERMFRVSLNLLSSVAIKFLN
ncbi:M20 metallopeptidase family protein [Desulfosporosinus metallidurans]|uniref:Peptidase M20D, amidohydrolase n=1 Tax=Desulfosporosinus metallidurans TaxID=1888891 RepID=A0A1Q8R0S2_9FIRM|nr:M20 family metallopeptidase [Desulfosporosinus metallidurans]OLN32990.1 Peptidase M20D, amidohydrolase [Desulfosporosinus metallidurans]